MILIDRFVGEHGMDKRKNVVEFAPRFVDVRIFLNGIFAGHRQHFHDPLIHFPGSPWILTNVLQQLPFACPVWLSKEVHAKDSVVVADVEIIAERDVVIYVINRGDGSVVSMENGALRHATQQLEDFRSIYVLFCQKEVLRWGESFGILEGCKNRWTLRTGRRNDKQGHRVPLNRNG